MAPSKFDLESFRRSRRELMQASLAPPEERHRLERLPTGKNPDGFVVRLRRLPARRVAYIRVYRPYEGDMSGRRWRDCSPGPRLGASPMANGSDTNGMILKLSPWKSVATTWASKCRHHTWPTEK